MTDPSITFTKNKTYIRNFNQRKLTYGWLLDYLSYTHYLVSVGAFTSFDLQQCYWTLSAKNPMSIATINLLINGMRNYKYLQHIILQTFKPENWILKVLTTQDDDYKMSCFTPLYGKWYFFQFKTSIYCNSIKCNNVMEVWKQHFATKWYILTYI